MRARIWAKISAFSGKRCVTWLSYTILPLMATVKMPLWPSLRLAVIPNSFLIAACRLEAWGR